MRTMILNNCLKIIIIQKHDVFNGGGGLILLRFVQLHAQ